ncbi:MAG: acetolactate synthase small subunit [Pseudomonadota bacterium]
MKSTLSVLIRNQVGVVSDATEVFKAHNINLHSVSCSETEAFDVSRLIITLEADDVDLATVRGFLAEKDFVIQVEDWSAMDLVDRELALVKVNVTRETTTQIMQVGEVFRATVVGMGPSTLTFEATGDMRRIDSFIKMLRPFGIKCLARTGAVALLRNDR